MEEVKKIFIDEEDFGFLNEVDKKVKECFTHVGSLEDQKLALLSLTARLREKREQKVAEMQIKYRLPKGCRWAVDPQEKRIVFTDKDGNAVDHPVIVDQEAK